MKKNEFRKDFFLGKSIERYSAEISMRNRNNLKAFSLVGILMMSFAIAFGWIMRDIFTFNTEFLIMWAYFFIMYLINRFFGRHIKHITAAFYLFITPIMVMGIIMGTFGDPTQPSITIMVFLCVLPMFILDKPFRIILFILINSVVYAICCYAAKTTILFLGDIIDLILFTVLSIGVNCLILQDRIISVEYAMNMMLAAETDTLTNINNRGSGVDEIELLIKQGTCGMFLLIDLDDFKNINDNYGHTIGDKVLIALAGCLKQSFRSSDIVMRFGGDEFGVFAQNLKNHEDRIMCIDRMMENIHNISLSEVPGCCFNVSVGISTVDSGHSKNFEKLYDESDKALYRSKHMGKNSYSFFHDN